MHHSRDTVILVSKKLNDLYTCAAISQRKFLGVPTQRLLDLRASWQVLERCCDDLEEDCGEAFQSSGDGIYVR